MKKIAILLMLIITSSSNFNAQKHRDNLKQKNMEITKNFEKFDFQTFNNRPKKDDSTYLLKKENGVTIYMSVDYDELSCVETQQDSYFAITKIYYHNGNIKMKGISYVNSFEKGIWFFFNESGKLIKEVDYDIPFKFSFDDILTFCRKEGIPVMKGYVDGFGLKTSIHRSYSEDSEHSEWIINWFKKPDKREIITLDGKNGKVISRKERDFINN